MSKKLQESNFEINKKLNTGLIDIKNYVSFSRFKPNWIVLPTSLVVLTGALTVFGINPFWHLFPIPVLIISVLLSWRINNSVFIIRNNIEKAES